MSSTPQGMFPGDVILKNALDLSLSDLKKNPWLIYDCFRVFVENSLLAQKYGMKEISNAKAYILNNEIPILLNNRIDKEQFPSVSISVDDSLEDKSLATLGDSSPDIQEYTPEDIQQPISYIIPPFNVVSYDKTQGLIELPTDIENYKYIDENMIICDKKGNGFIILGKGGTNGILIAPDSELPTGQLGIVPYYQIYRARRERITSQEKYIIECNVCGDPSYLLYLFPIVKYCLLRYRQSLLEHENAQISTISCSPIYKNDSFNTENVFSRNITLQFQVEESWVKTPYRVIENVIIPQQGLTILSNLDSPSGTENDSWTTKEDN